MFEKVNDTDELMAKLKENMRKAIDDLDVACSDFYTPDDRTDSDEQRMVNDIASALDEVWNVVLEYREKKAKLKESEENEININSDFNRGFLLGMFFAEVMGDK